MKSIQNLLRSNANNAKLNNEELQKTKGGTTTPIIVETQIDITCNIDGISTLVYCDRRRKRIG